MKLTLPAKVGLGLVGIGLAAFLAVAIWMKTLRTTLADIPMPMRAETVGRDFTVDYDGPIYSVDVMFDQSVPDAHARCLLGATNSEILPDLDCSGTAPSSSSRGNCVAMASSREAGLRLIRGAFRQRAAHCEWVSSDFLL